MPAARLGAIERHALPEIYQTLLEASPGRGVVMLGPRRVGKTVLLHQIANRLLLSGVEPGRVVLLSLDDPALQRLDLGSLLDHVERLAPQVDGPRYLLLDEIQTSPDWSAWLKRIADRRDPYIFLATGSSATALRHGGQDAGLGRWREMTLYPWSFLEHADLRGFDLFRIDGWSALQQSPAQATISLRLDLDKTARLDAALSDYLLRGGFPEVAIAPDLPEARRRLRQDILERALGRDIVDVQNVSARVLERMFLRVCLNPGGLWSDAEVAKDLELSRATVAKYLEILERAFLVFSLPNFASLVKGQRKVYLVAPAIRQALLGLDATDLENPDEWGKVVENAVVATAVGTIPDARIGFWRRGRDECDLVIQYPDGPATMIEVKRGSRRAERGIAAARAALGVPGLDWILGRSTAPAGGGPIVTHAAVWLAQQRADAGGTLRIGG